MDNGVSPLQRLEHVALYVTDLEENVRWYRDLVGLTEVHRTDDKVYMAVGSKPTWDVALSTGPGGLDYFSASIEDEAELGALVDRLRGNGVEVTELQELDPMILGGVKFQLPGGQNMRVVLPEKRLVYTVATDVYFDAVFAPKELHHVNLAVDDVAGLERFLVDNFNMGVSDHVFTGPGGNLLLGFWRFDTNHHDIAAVNAGGNGIHHYCFSVSSIGDLVAIADRLAALGWWKLENGIGRHGAGNNLYLYVRDPTGHIVEFSTDLARVNDRGAPPRVWERPEVSGNLWGPVEPPASFLHQVS